MNLIDSRLIVGQLFNAGPDAYKSTSPMIV